MTTEHMRYLADEQHSINLLFVACCLRQQNSQAHTHTYKEHSTMATTGGISTLDSTLALVEWTTSLATTFSDVLDEFANIVQAELGNIKAADPDNDAEIEELEVKPADAHDRFAEAEPRTGRITEAGPFAITDDAAGRSAAADAAAAPKHVSAIAAIVTMQTAVASPCQMETCSPEQSAVLHRHMTSSRDIRDPVVTSGAWIRSSTKRCRSRTGHF